MNRRSFLGMLGSASALSVAGSLGAPLVKAEEAKQRTRSLFVASSSGGEDDGVHVFRVRSGIARPMQFIPSPRPSSLALSEDGRTLYVANRIRRFRDRPCGSVEAYRVDAERGTLTLLGRQSLALSATEPMHLSLTADSQHLAVCVHGGGSYNLLPLGEDGHLHPVSILRKEVGCGLHTEAQASAHPTHAVHDAHGRMLSADLGADRINVFAVEETHLQSVQRFSLPSGSGPSMLALDQGSNHLFALQALSGHISSFRYDSDTGQISPLQSSVQAAPRGAQITGMHLTPSQNTLVSAWHSKNSSALVAWAIEPTTGALQQVHELSLAGEVTAIAPADTANTFLAMNRTTNTVQAFRTDVANGALTSVGVMARVVAPGAIAWL